MHKPPSRTSRIFRRAKHDLSFMLGLLPGLLGIAAFVAVLILGLWWAETRSCERVCKENGTVSYYEAFGGGCYCRDSNGLYNPRDSRDERRR